MGKIQITGRDWDMSGWPPEEITVEGIVMPLQGCGSNDDPAAVVDAYGRVLHIVGIRRAGDRVELVVDTERPRYQRRPTVAAMLESSPDRLAHEMRRHPDGVPEPDAYAEGAGGKMEPLWLPRPSEWRIWRSSFPGRTGRPRQPEA